MLSELKSQCESCTRCALCKTRTHIVFGRGNEKARLMFIGEAPGAKEDETGQPFVGAAGKLLDAYLGAVGISPTDYYITNILKCRPPQNRDPLPEEEEACKPFLEAQIERIQPKLVVCLGRIAAMRLIKAEFKITAEHGIWFDKPGYRSMAVYHPAALLRDPRKKEEMLSDFHKIEQAYFS